MENLLGRHSTYGAWYVKCNVPFVPEILDVVASVPLSTLVPPSSAGNLHATPHQHFDSQTEILPRRHGPTRAFGFTFGTEQELIKQQSQLNFVLYRYSRALSGAVMQNDVIRPYRAMAHNNRWANHRLLTACAALSQDELAATRVSFFPSLSATLNHILIIDRLYVDAMEGGSLGPAAYADPEPCKTVAALREAQTEIDLRLIAIAEALNADGLGRIVALHRETHIQRERIDRVLLHLFQHQVHHRGQAHAMLSGTSVVPPQLDEFFLAGEAPLRTAEFAELGWTEDRLWSDDRQRSS